MYQLTYTINQTEVVEFFSSVLEAQEKLKQLVEQHIEFKWESLTSIPE